MKKGLFFTQLLMLSLIAFILSDVKTNWVLTPLLLIISITITSLSNHFATDVLLAEVTHEDN